MNTAEVITAAKNSRKTQNYWHQIYVMTKKLEQFNTPGYIDENDIEDIIKTLKRIKQMQVNNK